ncbi:uncharacterized protein ARMOST_03214 [Armillaria ostoyae]|uniref:Reverse transcriptase domain-containing protein n=1 Tax=Armillaria ostoyae TaxID=47428 RepID=A0A284QU05_ARMOS|nr:uncharacterized protein ARMOST_03214 [Armillaria ostoyae]
MAVRLRDKIHLDPCLNFGASLVPGIWGRIADAMVKILLHQGVEALLKWVDDFIFFRYPKQCAGDGEHEYRYTEDIIWNTAEKLGWPWAHSKFLLFTFTFVYMGFLWDLMKKEVSLPEVKKEKYRCKLQAMGERHKNLSGGYRIHHRHAQPHMLDGPSRQIENAIPTLHEDMEWWKEMLAKDFVGIKIMKLTESLNIKLMVDASTSWGIGLILDNRWLA